MYTFSEAIKMIIDFHTHCFPDKLAQKAMPMLALRSGNCAPAFDGTAAELKKSVLSAGASKAAVLNIATNAHQQTKVNDFAISLLGDDILIPFGSVHFDSPDALDELQRLHDAGIKGIKLHPDYQGFFADDEKMFPIYKKIGELNMITVFHAGVDIGVPDPVHCTPDMLKKILPYFGSAPVVAAHMGGFLLWREAAEKLGNTGIYIDTAFSACSVPPAWAKESVESFGADHVLFGSDNPWSSTEREIGYIRSLGLSEQETELILGGNAERLLGL